jgi:hypothetical protein
VTPALRLHGVFVLQGSRGPMGWVFVLICFGFSSDVTFDPKQL